MSKHLCKSCRQGPAERPHGRCIPCRVSEEFGIQLTGYRREMATQLAKLAEAVIVKQVREKGIVEYSGGPLLRVSVHWDDCDSDERSFWFHFRFPAVGEKRDKDVPRVASGMVVRALGLVARLVNLATREYQMVTTVVEVPKPVREWDTRKVVAHDGDTWIAKCAFYG